MTVFCFRGVGTDGARSGCFRRPLRDPWSFDAGGLPELELGATHDKGGQQVEGVRGVGRLKVGDLFVDELIGLGGDVAANQGGLEDMEGNILAGRAGWLHTRVEFGGENGFRVFCAW